METEEIKKCLQDMRNNIAKNKESTTENASKLFSWLFGKEDWTNEQCISAYKAILEHYIIDDPQTLKMMLAVSGLSEGYRNPHWSAAKRRGKYLDDLQQNNPSVELGVSAIYKQEETQILEISNKLKEDHDNRSIPQSLIEQCIGATSKTKNESSSPSETEENTNNYPKEKPELNTSKRKERRGLNFIIEQFNINFQIHRGIYVVLLIIALLISVCWIYSAVNLSEQANEPESSPVIQPTLFPTAPPIEIIFVSDKDITIAPNLVDQIKFAVYPSEADTSTISIVSSDPDVLTVARDGMITAYAGQPGEKQRRVTVTIQAENGISKSKIVTVDFTKGTDYKPITDINTYEPEFMVEQYVRLVGTKEWSDTVEDVKVGDKVEFRIEYCNVSKDGRRHEDVMIKDILPKNLRYVSGTTMLRNNYHPDGLTTNEDDVVTTGINIGDYNAQSNAFVYFTAEVVDNSLAYGSNTLVNWSQCGVGQTTLQDYATVQLYKK